MEELELVKCQIGGSTIRITKLNLYTLTGWPEYIRFKHPYTEGDIWMPDLQVQEVYPFTLYIKEYTPKKSTIYSTWVSTLADGDNIVKLIKKNNFSEIDELITTIEQYLREHEIRYEDFKDLKETTLIPLRNNLT